MNTHINIVGAVRMHDGELVVVKKFKRPTLANRLIYTWVRKPKTRRAFDNALMLRQHGIDTAEPIGYVELSHNGVFDIGYFVQTHVPHKTLTQTLAQLEGNRNEKRLLCDDLVTHMAHMHHCGILPLDNNTGNILVNKRDGHYRFTLVDVNRLLCQETLPTGKIMRSLVQMRLLPHEEAVLMVEYCKRRGLNIERGAATVIIQHRLMAAHSSLHHLLRTLTAPFHKKARRQSHSASQ